jgi:hypothetical protein
LQSLLQHSIENEQSPPAGRHLLPPELELDPPELDDEEEEDELDPLELDPPELDPPELDPLDGQGFTCGRMPLSPDEELDVPGPGAPDEVPPDDVPGPPDEEPPDEEPPEEEPPEEEPGQLDPDEDPPPLPSSDEQAASVTMTIADPTRERPVANRTEVDMTMPPRVDVTLTRLTPPAGRCNEETSPWMGARRANREPDSTQRSEEHRQVARPFAPVGLR